jgi:diacylglycerol kinase (ATP)
VTENAGVDRVRILWNPASGRGRGARAFPRIQAAFAAFGLTDTRATEAAGDEARLVREALDDGITTLVVCGGDGTWSKCAVPLARAGSPARMVFLAAGTGNDFAKNLRAPARDPAAIARLVAHGGVERRVDMGRVDDHWFLNVAGFGFDVAVLRATQRIPLLRGNAVYVAAAVRELFGFDGLDVAVTGGSTMTGDQMARRLMLVFSNGREFGGAFRIAPGARVDDGALDALIFGDAGSLARVPLLARAIRGTHLPHPLVAHHAGDRFRLRFRERTYLEADGELRQTVAADAEVVCLPGVLRVLDTLPQT